MKISTVYIGNSVKCCLVANYCRVVNYSKRNRTINGVITVVTQTVCGPVSFPSKFIVGFEGLTAVSMKPSGS
jgi:hypothetical protein